MSKIDWKKPLRTVDWEMAKRTTGRQPEVYTFKSGSQRVVWVDDRVYPVDAQGCCTADVGYPGFRKCEVGDPIVENVPEEPKDHLHLYRREGEEWKIDFGSGQLYTKEYAENLSRGWAYHAGAKNTVVVKVPV